MRLVFETTKGGTCGPDSLRNIRAGMRRREEDGLKLGRGKIDSLFQHRPKEPREGKCIGLLRRSVVRDRSGREKQGHHRTDPIEGHPYSQFPGGFQKAFAEQTATLFQLSIDARL